MNDTTTREATPAKAHKSKRLSSLVWIVVLWGFVRLIAEMDGISWKRAWNGLAGDFGLYPATSLLLLAIVIDASPQRKLVRLMALVVVVASFSAFWVTVGSSVRDWVPSIQWSAVATIFIFVFMKMYGDRTAP